MNARVRRITWLALAMAVIAGGCYLLASSDTYGTVARNSLLLDRVDANVDWPMVKAPAGFGVETFGVPPGPREGPTTTPAKARTSSTSVDSINALRASGVSASLAFAAFALDQFLQLLPPRRRATLFKA